METENNVTSLRVASFSCYLDTADSNFMQKIKRALEDPASDAISSPEKAFPVSSGRSNKHITQSPRVASFSHYLSTAEEKKAVFKAAQKMATGAENTEKLGAKDGEIDIFGADRYFNMNLDDEAEPKSGYCTDRAANLHRQKPNSGSATPSVYSAASSWNSQTALLRKLQKSASNVKQKKALGRRLLASFACSGPCLTKKAVFVSRSTDYGSRTNDHLPGHVLYPKTESFSDGKVLEDPRQSLEVFGCRETKRGGLISANLERKVSMLAWDAIPKAQSLATTTTNYSSTVCDDMASDASSDLFEIEHISGHGYGLLGPDEPDTMSSSCLSPTPYAPSEASIEWSVVTASAAEYSSVISDYEERSVSVAGDPVPRTQNRADKTRHSLSKGAPKSNKTGGLLGCNSQKAVSVAETVHKTAKDPYVSLSKLQATAKVKDIDSLQSQQFFTPRLLTPRILLD